jgi:TonB family protein
MAQPDFGRYKIVEEVGRGAMGVVYRATDPAIGRTVALKVINEAYLETIGVRAAEYFERFRREAETAGRLSHPNIVKIYDLGPRFIVMEFVEGESLAAVIRARKRLPLSKILRFVEEAAAALDYAHSRHIVHRDVKPANFMIQPNGVVKVMDFGLARIESSTLTAAGEILGSAAYMAPEVIKGRPADARSDIFSLGVVAYELMTGDRPFGGGSISTIISKILRESPRPARELNVRLPPDYDTILARALAKEPEGRYATAGDFASALVLKKWADDEPPADAAATSNTQTLSPEQRIAPGEESGGLRPTVEMTAAEFAAAVAAADPGAETTAATPPVPETLHIPAAAAAAAQGGGEAVSPAEATLVAAGSLEDLLDNGETPPPFPRPAPSNTAAASGPTAPTGGLPPPPPPGAAAPPSPPALPEREPRTETLDAVKPVDAVPPPAAPRRVRWMPIALGCSLLGLAATGAGGFLLYWALNRQAGLEPAAGSSAAAPAPSSSAPSVAPGSDAPPGPAPAAEANGGGGAAVAPAQLAVSSTPDGARVLVARRPRGTTPVRLELPPGRQRVEVRKDGFKPWSSEVTLAPGEQASLQARLEPLPAAAPPSPTAAPVVRRGDLVPMTPAVTPPKKLAGNSPSLPRGSKTPVSVLVEYVVTEEGRVTGARILESGGAELDRACVEAVSGWRFEPAWLNGVQVKVTRTVRFSFRDR